MGVSSLDGLGFDEFLKAVDAARVEYEQDYLPQLQRMKKKKDEEAAAEREEQLERLKKDRAEGEVVDINLPSATGKHLICCEYKRSDGSRCKNFPTNLPYGARNMYICLVFVSTGTSDQQSRRGIEINLMADSEDSDDIAMDDSDEAQQQASFRTFLHKKIPSRQDSMDDS